MFLIDGEDLFLVDEEDCEFEANGFWYDDEFYTCTDVDLEDYDLEPGVADDESDDESDDSDDEE